MRRRSRATKLPRCRRQLGASIPRMMDGTFAFAHFGQLFLAAAVCVVGAAGCQGEVVPVSGRVTLDGKPLANAVVTFQPIGSGPSAETTTTGSVGRTDSEGRFVLRLVSPEQSGAAVGGHVVTINRSTEGIDEAAAENAPLPLAWRNGSQQFRVPPGGTREATFDIKAEMPANRGSLKGIPAKNRRGS
jgi:hypothetical protein